MLNQARDNAAVDATRLTIRFGNSKSINYNSALSRLKRFEGAKLIAEGSESNEVSISIPVLIDSWQRVSKLLEMVGSWKATEILLDDEVIDQNQLSDYYLVAQCCARYKKNPTPDTHCWQSPSERGFGCQHLRAVLHGRQAQFASTYPGRPLPWYSFGQFTQDGKWQLDKVEIEERLALEAKAKKLLACPQFSMESVREIISELPDVIEPSTDSAWEIRFETTSQDVTEQKRAIGIQPAGPSVELIEEHLRRIEEDRSDTRDSDQSATSRNIPATTFDEIGGIEAHIEKIREVIELPIKRPEIFETLGIKPHKGIILYGPPGTGKTLVARAVANEIGAHFIPIGGPELLNKYIGQSEENLRAVFAEAQRIAPSVIFFDEIDAIAQVRSGGEHNRYYSQFVNQLLALMDGIDESERVCVLASTNRLELIDPALLRPGRFDYHLEIGHSDQSGCLKILRIHTRNMPLDPSFDLEAFSGRLNGSSGADIAHVAREAAYNAMRRSLDLGEALKSDKPIESSTITVLLEDFEQALDSLRGSRS